MKKLSCCVAGLVFVIIAICPLAWPQTVKPYEGMQPFVPTRLEWVALEFNATSRVDLSPDSGYLMYFRDDSARDTIVIYIRYLPRVNREIMNRSIEAAKKGISSLAEARGWSSWLKIREDVEMIKPK